jgi:hypothetical protein
MGATTGSPRKVAMGAGGIKTLEANIATTANGSTNFRGNAILLNSLFDLLEALAAPCRRVVEIICNGHPFQDGSVRDLKRFR